MSYIMRTIKLDGKRVKVKAWKGGITVYRRGYTETAPAEKLESGLYADSLPADDVDTIRKLWADYRAQETMAS